MRFRFRDKDTNVRCARYYSLPLLCVYDSQKKEEEKARGFDLVLLLVSL